jgi:hypothetical protein
MGHHETNENLSPEEKKFRELMHNGDDFFKIEIYRSAKTRYREAATMNIDNEAANKKAEERQALLQKENRAIYIIVAIVAAAVAMILIF